ncbi:MAG: hopanoid biosynthesis-associated RND transporter HpnN, partial [Rhizobiales bacterium]|nr:hopanoid biosynthesis-associated RND transporter HpnN [Hyphomicrobiales bacterium]
MRIITSFVVRAIRLCAHYAAPVIILSVLLGVLSSWYAVTHFKMTTDVNQLISSNISWRQREAEMEKAFPHFELIVAVVNAPTVELVEGATNALAQRLAQQKDLFRSIDQPKGGPFFAQHGLLFQSTADLGSQMNMLTQAQRLVQVLAGDPSLRGVIQTLQFGLLGVQGGQITLDNMAWPMTLAADTIEKVNAGKPANFSWYELVQGHAPASSDLTRFLEIRATLDYSELEPGKRATDAIRKAANDLDLPGK